jgi:hypothetical protein
MARTGMPGGMWRYVVFDAANKSVKESGYDYYDQQGALRAAEEYVAKHKPSTEGGWSSNAEKSA